MATPLTVLVAEDESLNALALQSQLEALGHRVAGPARNGREAIDIARVIPIDLAILAVRISELDGLVAAEQILEDRPVPIILLTGYDDPEYRSWSSLAPVAHYLVKPVSLEDLSPAIRTARSRFEEWKRSRLEAEVVERKREEDTVIEEATAVLMELRELTEPAAYRLIEKESRDRNQPLVEVARTVLMAESILRDQTVPE